MKVTNLSGEVKDWKPTGNIVTGSDSRPRSKLHIAARGLIYELFPTMQIMEEVPIRPLHSTLHLDFYISKIKLAIEVHGKQHYAFSSLFHASRQDFFNQKKRDANKKNWCEINNITYIELPYNEDIDKWKTRIQRR